MVNGVTGRHPAQDVLADLAAEVLPDGEARLVEAHVIGCGRCADLLADAERMRRLLMSNDPGPMPAEVWDRIARSLAGEAGAHVAHADQGPAAASEPWVTAEWPADAGWVPAPAEAAAYPEANTAQWEQFAVSDVETGGADDSTGPGLDPAPPRRPVRRTASSLRSRRQIRSEDRTMSMLRYARPLGIAAAVLVLAGAAGLAVAKLPLGDSPSGVTTAADAGASASAGDPDRAAAVPGTASAGLGAQEDANTSGTLTRATGTNYTAEDLAARAVALTPDGRQTPAPAPLSAADASGDEAQPLNRAPSISGNATLTDPVKLAECLAALNVESQQPIAVDFARFEGEDAAIIVMAARDGGYQVYAVRRTCGPDDSGALKSTTAASP